MRLHRLTLRAIGPFPDEHTIDLAALGASGLFLLEGPTGAGKSTVIDAVVFALYGRTAGTTTSTERLVSGHAAPGVEPFVELVLETTAGIYRVRRSPEHLRPKQRGTGTTKEPAKVLLWRLTDPDEPGGQPVSTRVGEADAELARVVGLSREQFVQTVVLPQGEFAAFLRAAPDERRPLLQRLFGTDVYQRLQEELAVAAREARRAAERTRESVVGAITAVVRSARDAVGVGPGGGPQDTPGEVDLLADRLAQLEEMTAEPEASKVRSLVGDVLGSLEARVAAAETAEAAALARAESARAAREAARALDARFAERDALVRERAAVAAAAPAWGDAAGRLDAAGRAAEVRPLLEGAQQAASTASAAGAALEAALREARAGAHAELAAAGVDLRQAALEAAAERGALAPVLALEQGLPALHRRHDRAGAAVTVGTGRLADLEAGLSARPQDRAALVARLEARAGCAAGAAAAELRIDEARRVARESAAAALAAAELAEARAALTAALGAATRAVEHEAAVRRARLAGLAGELAGALEPGRPCAVCGSTEHPAPAVRPAGAVTTADVEAAEAARVAAEAAAATLGARCATLDERRRAGLEACGGLGAETAEAALAAATAALSEARRAAGDVAALEAELAAHDATTLALESERRDAADALARARAEHDAVTARLAEDTATVGQACDGGATVAERAARLAERAAVAQRLDAARQDEEHAATALLVALGRRDEACAGAGFADAEAASTALLDAAERRRLQVGLDEHRRRALLVDERLAQPEIEDLADRVRPDLPAAERAHAEAQGSAVTATRTAERARAHLAAVARDAHLLDAALAAQSQAVRAGEPVQRMAALATGGEGNDRRTTLATYVLLRRFEDVVAAANERLSAISDGRFTLARIDEREGGVQARKTGLGLVVEDHLTGDRRTPRTLSGGETFYVSLCLALGLADVVSAEAGGVDLGTLVIDEGFGSLDPATLDSVMAELARLRDGGRVVAVVSHVEELKQRIPDRLEVRRRADGSSTLTVRA